VMPHRDKRNWQPLNVTKTLALSVQPEGEARNDTV